MISQKSVKCRSFGAANSVYCGIEVQFHKCNVVAFMELPHLRSSNRTPLS